MSTRELQLVGLVIGVEPVELAPPSRLTIHAADTDGDQSSWSAAAVTPEPRLEWFGGVDDQAIEFVTADRTYRTRAGVRAEEFGAGGYTSLVFTPSGGLDDE